MEDGTLNGSTVQQFLERGAAGVAISRRRGGPSLDTVGIRRRSRGFERRRNRRRWHPHAGRRRPLWGRSGSRGRLVQRDAVLEPIEHLPHGQARSPETGNSAHA